MRRAGLGDETGMDGMRQSRSRPVAFLSHVAACGLRSRGGRLLTRQQTNQPTNQPTNTTASQPPAAPTHSTRCSYQPTTAVHSINRLPPPLPPSLPPPRQQPPLCTQDGGRAEQGAEGHHQHPRKGGEASQYNSRKAAGECWRADCTNSMSAPSVCIRWAACQSAVFEQINKEQELSHFSSGQPHTAAAPLPVLWMGVAGCHSTVLCAALLPLPTPRTA